MKIGPPIRSKLPEHVPGEVLVKLRNAPSLLDSFTNDYRVEVAETLPLPGQRDLRQSLLRLTLPEGMSTAQAVALMEDDPRVEYAASNDILHSTLQATHLPKDLSPKLWGLHNSGQSEGKAGADIHAAQAWALTTGTRQGPVVAVVDSGVDYNHVNLKDNIWTNPSDQTHGYNAITDSHDPMDDDSHGTHCSGTIAAQGQQGIYGINWQAQVMPIKFLGADGGGKTSDAIKGLAWAAQQGARISSNSWGGASFNPAMRDALASSPMLHIFAAGNDGTDNDTSPFYPASYELPNLISVAATDRRDELGSFSNFGANSVHLAAPGVEIYSTTPNNHYEQMDGTSMAAPHVSGAATLVASAFPGISNDQLKARLLYGAEPVAALQGKVLSGGRLNLANSLKQDELSPAQPGDLQLQAQPGKVRLDWVAPGDDGMQGGPVAEHLLRYSDRPIVDGPPQPGQVSFEQATPVKVGRPGQPGAREQATAQLPLSDQERPLYFALKSVDHVGNLSPMASARATVPAASLLFLDKKDPSQWVASGRWGLQEIPGRGQVWTDSPGGDYDNNSDSSLTSQPISLAGSKAPRLVFEEKYQTELDFDFVSVEVSSDGKKWDRLDSKTGSAAWAQREIDLSRYADQTVQIRFRLQADASGKRDGVYLDHIAVSA